MFRKYQSIENHYQSKHINWWLEHFPDLEKEEFVLQEKLHGSNIQLVFTPDKNLTVCSRNRVLEEGENFFGVFELLETEEYQEIINHMQKLSNISKKEINLYGELFGKGIQKGVEYQDEKKILFFDMKQDGILYTPLQLEGIMILSGLEKYLVPTFKKVVGLKAAVETNVEFDTIINPEKGNTSEGVIIKPYNKVYRSPMGEIFYLKKKNEAFKEKQKSKKPKKEEPSELLELNEEFKTFINKNRIESVFSKEGEIQDPSQIGNYIKLVVEDAKEDFLKENSEAIKDLDKKELKVVFNHGSLIVNFLKEYL